MDIFIRIQRNLYLRDSVLISYQTEVADIVGTELRARGVYSQTTNKHLHEACRVLGLKFVKSTKLGSFGWKDLGSKEAKPGRLLSEESGHKVMSLMREGMDLHQSLYWLLQEGAKLRDLELAESALQGVDIEGVRATVTAKRIIF
jgi:hypothetical protein